MSSSDFDYLPTSVSGSGLEETMAAIEETSREGESDATPHEEAYGTGSDDGDLQSLYQRPGLLSSTHDGNASNGNGNGDGDGDDKDLEAFLWSENPERTYFMQMMEERAAGRVADGKRGDDSIIGESTMASFMRDDDNAYDFDYAAYMEDLERQRLSREAAPPPSVVDQGPSDYEDDLSTIADTVTGGTSGRGLAKGGKNSSVVTPEKGRKGGGGGDDNSDGTAPETPPGFIRVPQGSDAEENGGKLLRDFTYSGSDQSRTREERELAEYEEHYNDQSVQGYNRTRRIYILAGIFGCILLVAIIVLAITLAQLRDENSQIQSSSDVDPTLTTPQTSPVAAPVLPMPEEESSDEEDKPDVPVVVLPPEEAEEDPPTASPTESPSSAPTELTAELIARRMLTGLILERFPDSEGALADDLSPQSRALTWLATDPGLDGYPDRKLLHRWALAVFGLSFHHGDGLTVGAESVFPNWLDYEKDECDWFEGQDGMACDKGRVSVIELNEQNLHGELPPELGLLSDSLIRLDLPMNKISGTIPSAIGLLDKVWRIQLTWNNLQGTLPTEVGEIRSLWLLGLGRNSLEGFLPSQLGNLKGLSTCGLEQNGFVGSLPSELGDISQMKFFAIDDNKFSGELPDTLANWRNLQSLKVHTNAFTGTIPEGYCALLDRELSQLEGDCSICEGSCCTRCVERPRTDDCGSSISLPDSCFVMDDEIVVSFFNCDPRDGDWIGIYDASQDTFDTDAPPLWVQTCGDQECREGKEAGTVILTAGESPLPAGQYKAMLFRPTDIGEYEIAASSTPFEVTGTRC